MNAAWQRSPDNVRVFFVDPDQFEHQLVHCQHVLIRQYLVVLDFEPNCHDVCLNVHHVNFDYRLSAIISNSLIFCHFHCPVNLLRLINLVTNQVEIVSLIHYFLLARNTVSV